MVLSLLKEAGIDCYIKDEHTITIDPLLSPALGGMKLMVKKEEMQLALSILERSDQLYLRSIPCHNCGQNTLQSIREIKSFPNWWDKLKNIIINGQENEERTYYRCYQCGERFNELADS